MKRQRFQVDSETGITLSISILQEQGINLGDCVDITLNDQGQILIEKSNQLSEDDGISDDFYDVLEQNVQKHHKTIRGLKDR